MGSTGREENNKNIGDDKLTLEHDETIDNIQLMGGNKEGNMKNTK